MGSFFSFPSWTSPAQAAQERRLLPDLVFPAALDGRRRGLSLVLDPSQPGKSSLRHSRPARCCRDHQQVDHDLPGQARFLDELQHIQYAYTGGDYRISISTTISPGTYRRIDVGDYIPVLYLPERQATIASIHPASRRSIAGAPSAVSPLPPPCAVSEDGDCGISTNRTSSSPGLAARGARCQGEVTRLVDVNTGKGGVRTYLEFSFRTQRGETIEGRTDYVNGWGNLVGLRTIPSCLL